MVAAIELLVFLVFLLLLGGFFVGFGLGFRPEHL